MKIIVKNYSLIALSLFLLSLLIMPVGIAFAGPYAKPPAQSAAQTVTPVVVPTLTPLPSSFPAALSPIPGLLQNNVKAQIPDATDTFTFEQFDLDETTMRGPFATSGYYFDLPATWRMNEGAVLRLSLDSYYTGSNTGSTSLIGTPSPSNYIGTLEIQYNYTTVGKVDITRDGRMQIDVLVPLDVINRYGTNQGHSILLILDSEINCYANSSTTVVVRSTSQLYMPHDLVAPPVDLRLLPLPFSQNSFNPDTAIIIVPDQPTAEELKAALSVAAGFGSMTYNGLSLSLLPISQANKDVLASTNLIFVGKDGNLPLLQKVPLAIPAPNDSFSLKDAAPTDGIVQLALSPWNETKVVMSVGGREDAGVVKAARAVSTGMLQVGLNSSFSLVSDVQLKTSQYNITNVNQTFADLGYESLVADQVGLNILNYAFNIPPNYTLGPDAYLDLTFSHTALLEYQRSTIVVNLNGQPVGSVRLSDETVGQGNAKIFLPASAARPGVNNLSLDVNLEARNQCVNPLLNGLWMRIDSSSSFHLPFIPNLATTSTLIDLSRYPFPFSFDPFMKDLAFILSANDPIGWNVAIQLASQLGNTNRVQIAGLEAYYADNIPEAAKQERNLVIIGKPSNLKILSDLYDVLPAPFEPGMNFASQKNVQVSYNLGSGADVGYLELLSAPWNENRTILYVGGSSELGVRWSGAALQFGRLRGQLRGNLSFINGEQIVSAETRFFQSDQIVFATVVPDNINSVVGAQENITERPAWIMPTILITLAGMLVVLGVLGAQILFKKRAGR